MYLAVWAAGKGESKGNSVVNLGNKTTSPNSTTYTTEAPATNLSSTTQSPSDNTSPPPTLQPLTVSVSTESTTMPEPTSTTESPLENTLPPATPERAPVSVSTEPATMPELNSTTSPSSPKPEECDQNETIEPYGHMATEVVIMSPANETVVVQFGNHRLALSCENIVMYVNDFVTLCLYGKVDKTVQWPADEILKSPGCVFNRQNHVKCRFDSKPEERDALKSKVEKYYPNFDIKFTILTMVEIANEVMVRVSDVDGAKCTEGGVGNHKTLTVFSIEGEDKEDLQQARKMINSWINGFKTIN